MQQKQFGNTSFGFGFGKVPYNQAEKTEDEDELQFERGDMDTLPDQENADKNV